MKKAEQASVIPPGLQTPTCRGRAQRVACLTALNNQMRTLAVSNDWSGTIPRNVLMS